MAKPSDPVALLARVSGRVQGVGFRAWTCAEARGLGLTGWVRNEADGSVTAMIQGAQGPVERLSARLADGPPGAHVISVSVRAGRPDTSLTGFRILL